MSNDIVSPGCLEFRNEVSRHYGWVLNEYGFVTVDERDSGGERCLIVAESPDCRLRFMFDRGVVEVHVGRKEARPSWTDGRTGSVEWFAITLVLSYLERRPKPTLKQLLEQTRTARGLSAEERMGQMAALLRQRAGDVFQLFREDAQGDRWREFVTYYTDTEDLARELQQKHGPVRSSSE